MREHQSMVTEEEDTMAQREPSLWIRRLLVIAFYLSVLACLLAIWLTGTLLGDPAQILPLWLLQSVAAHRVFVLGIPFACLLACYEFIRHATGDIMAVPERFLDERQKMVRDRAHRSAFTLVKLVCCLIPLLLLAQYLWLRQLASAPPAALMQQSFYTVFVPNSGLAQELQLAQAAQELKQPPHSPVEMQWFAATNVRPFNQLTTQTPVAPASTAEIALAAGILLLCLYLLFSALPMTVIAWKRQV